MPPAAGVEKEPEQAVNDRLLFVGGWIHGIGAAIDFRGACNRMQSLSIKRLLHHGPGKIRGATAFEQ